MLHHIHPQEQSESYVHLFVCLYSIFPLLYSSGLLTREWCCPQWMPGLPTSMNSIKTIAYRTGQPDLDNPSPRVSSQVILGVKLTIKRNHCNCLSLNHTLILITSLRSIDSYFLTKVSLTSQIHVKNLL